MNLWRKNASFASDRLGDILVNHIILRLSHCKIRVIMVEGPSGRVWWIRQFNGKVPVRTAYQYYYIDKTILLILYYYLGLKVTMIIWVSFTVYYISYINQCYNLLSGIVMSEILQSRSIICFVSMDYLVKDCFFWKKSRFRCSSMYYPILPFIFDEKLKFNHILLLMNPSWADLGRGLGHSDVQWHWYSCDLKLLTYGRLPWKTDYLIWFLNQWLRAKSNLNVIFDLDPKSRIESQLHGAKF